jgi:hypothetical protein
LLHSIWRAGVDWHNVIEVRGKVSSETELALEKLISRDVAVSILSYCFKNTRKTVLSEASKLSCADRLAHLDTTECRTGRNGKVDIYKRWGVNVIFDDAADVCQEAVREGFYVFPIKSRHESHAWFVKRAYSTLSEAVDEFIRVFVPEKRNR